MLSNTLRLNVLKLFEIYSHFSSMFLSKNIKIYSKKQAKEQLRSCSHEIVRLIIIKTIMEIKNTSYRYDINRPRSRHGHKYSKYKNCLSMMIFIGIKQHLWKIWSSIHEKVEQHWSWVEKKALLTKKACGITNKSIASYVFLWVKFVKVRYTRNVFFKKNFANVYMKRFVFSPFSPVVAWHII